MSVHCILNDRVRVMVFITTFNNISVISWWSVFLLYPRSTRVWDIQGYSCPSVRHTFGFRIIIKVWLNQIFSNFQTLLCTIKYRLSLITVYFTFTVPELWPFFSQKIGTLGILMSVRPSVRHTFGFRIIIKVPLNQIFSNFQTLLCTIKYRLSLIAVYFTFTVHELWPFFSQKIGTFQVSG